MRRSQTHTEMTNMQINSISNSSGNNTRSPSQFSNVFQDTFLNEYDDMAEYFDDIAWQSIPFNKNAPLPNQVQRLHTNMLMRILDQLPHMINAVQTELYVKYRTHFSPDMFCPVVVGGIAYTKYMEYANMDPSGIFFSDDIDIKILIKPTCEQLNSDRTYEPVRECIKLFRYMLTIRLMELATDILAEGNMARKYNSKVHYGHAGRYQSLDDLRRDVEGEMQPLQLSVISVTYGSGASMVQLGCVDMTFYVRENDYFDDRQLMIGYFYSYLRLAHASTANSIEPRTACDIVPRRDHVTIIANEEYIMLDTIRMLSKAEKFGDMCIRDKDQTPIQDVRKFDRYVGKFLQLAVAFGKLDANRAKEIYFNVFPVIPIRGEQTVREKFRILISHPEVNDIYKYYTQFLLEPSRGTMNIGGGGGSPPLEAKKKSRLRGGANSNTRTGCILLNPEQLYNDFGIVILRNNNDPDIDRPILFVPSSSNSPPYGGAAKPKPKPKSNPPNQTQTHTYTGQKAKTYKTDKPKKAPKPP